MSYQSQVLNSPNTFRISYNSDIADEAPVVFINSKKFAVRGDISFITGQPKAGKTSIGTYIIATALMQQVPESLDTLQIKTNFAQGKKIIYIDTEQPLSQTNRLRRKICKVLGTEKEPDNLIIFNIRAISRKDKKNEVYAIIDAYKDDLHLIIIDGIADLVKDPNGADESFDLIDDLMRRALSYNIPIIAYIHLNPNSDKTRGHMGSEAERKCGGMVTIKKDKDNVHSIESKYMRYDASIDPVLFVYDIDKGDFRSLTGNEAKEAKEKKELEKLNELYDQAHGIFAGGTISLNYTQIVTALTTNDIMSIRTAKNRIKQMVDSGFIRKDEKAMYSLIENLDLLRNIFLADKQETTQTKI